MIRNVFNYSCENAAFPKVAVTRKKSLVVLVRMTYFVVMDYEDRRLVQSWRKSRLTFSTKQWAGTLDDRELT